MSARLRRTLPSLVRLVARRSSLRLACSVPTDRKGSHAAAQGAGARVSVRACKSGNQYGCGLHWKSVRHRWCVCLMLYCQRVGVVMRGDDCSPAWMRCYCFVGENPWIIISYVRWEAGSASPSGPPSFNVDLQHNGDTSGHASHEAGRLDGFRLS